MRRLRSHRHAAFGALTVLAAGLGAAAPALAQPAVEQVSPAPTVTAPTSPGTGSGAVTQVTPAATPTRTTPTRTTTAATAPTATTPPAAAVGPPVLRNLKVPASVSAPQGHARFLVGVRVSGPGTVTAQVFDTKGDKLVQTTTATATAPGRVYMLLQATNQQGYQLPAGKYRIRLQASDAQSRVSNTLQKTVSLATTSPRGRLDMDLVPLWRPLARSLKLPAQGGQLVGALAPRGEAVKAGIRRGDVILSINSVPTLTTGQLQTALRGLPAGKPVDVQFRRGRAERTVKLTASPDWTPVADLSRAYAAAQNRSPKVLAVAVARALYLARTGKQADAAKLYAAWPRGWKRSAPGQFVNGRILERRKQTKPALGAYTRALARDARMGEAAMARGTILSQRGQQKAATVAFTKAAAIDPKDATAAAFEAFSMVRAELPGDALAPARSAVAIDPNLGEAKIALGLALVLNKQQARGVVALREGVTLTDNAQLATQVIDQYLEPTDK